MDSHLAGELIAQRYAEQPDAHGVRDRIYLAIRQLILQGELPPGTVVPPSRTLAGLIEAGRNTVVRAYDQLLIEGYLEGRVGAGTFVSEAVRSGERVPPPKRMIGTRRDGLSRRGNRIVANSSSSRIQSGAFMPGIPDVASFPFATWRRLVAKQIRVEQRHLAQYSAGGYGPLKVVLAEYLRVTRMMNISPRQVLILNGSHQAIDLCARLLCDPADRVWVEDPGYWGARNALSACDLSVCPIAVDEHGIAPSLQDWAQPPRMIFVSPSSQYPTGVVLSLERRLQMLDAAEANRTWIIEDDYDNEIRYHNHPVASLFGLSKAQRVIYLATFSKVMFPGLRLAYLVVPEDLVDAFAVGNAELYREGRLMEQAALAEFIEEGHFSAHLRRMRSIYMERRDALLDSIGRRLGGLVSVSGGLSGLHLPCFFEEPVDDVDLVARALAEGIVVRPLSMYYLGDERRRPGMNLGFAPVPAERVDGEVVRLARAIEGSRRLVRAG